MRRTAIVSAAALAAFVLSGVQAQAGFLFFGDCGAPKPSCSKPAPKACCKPAPKTCCKPAPKCCDDGPRCPLTGIKLPKLSLPKLSLPKLGGSSCGQKAVKCCKPAPPTCSGSKAHGVKKPVEDTPAPPYEDKAPAPAPPKEAAPAPAPAKEAAPAPEKKA